MNTMDGMGRVIIKVLKNSHNPQRYNCSDIVWFALDLAKGSASSKSHKVVRWFNLKHVLRRSHMDPPLHRCLHGPSLNDILVC